MLTFEGSIGLPPCEVLDGFPNLDSFSYGMGFDGTYLWVIYWDKSHIHKLDQSGNIVGQIPTPNNYVRCTGIAWDWISNVLWVHSNQDKKIYKGDPSSGSVLTSFSSPASTYPTGLTFDGVHLWAVDRDQYKIYEVTTSGSVVSSFNIPITPQPQYGPRGLAFEPLAPGGGNLILFMTHFNASGGLDSTCIYEITRDGIYTGSKCRTPGDVNANGRLVEVNPEEGEDWVDGGYNGPIHKIRGFYPPALEAPMDLTANGGSPSPWTNDSMFVINWTNPSHASGIAKALYKFDSAPTSNYDTTGSMSGTSPDTVCSTVEGIRPLYVWVVDGSGNLDYNNTASVDLRYGATPPAEPESLYANDSIQVSAWTNDSVFVIRYVQSDSLTKSGTGFKDQGLGVIRKNRIFALRNLLSNKGDTSGIEIALYKLGVAPISNYDTTGTDTLDPFNVICTQQCECMLFVWLKEVAGNLNYENNSWVILRYDNTLPLIDSTTVWNDTFAFWGPFPVETKITDNWVFNEPLMFYRTSEDTNWISDTTISLGGGWYIDSIPEQTPQDSLLIDYYLTVEDSASNISRDPSSGCYSFMIYLTGVEEIVNFPDRFVLFSPSPNPSLRGAVIRYGLPEKASASLKLYDILGRFVKNIYSGVREKGYYKANIEHKYLAKGVYFIRFVARDYKATKKLILMR